MAKTHRSLESVLDPSSNLHHQSLHVDLDTRSSMIEKSRKSHQCAGQTRTDKHTVTLIRVQLEPAAGLSFGQTLSVDVVLSRGVGSLPLRVGALVRAGQWPSGIRGHAQSDGLRLSTRADGTADQSICWALESAVGGRHHLS